MLFHCTKLAIFFDIHEFYLLFYHSSTSTGNIYGRYDFLQYSNDSIHTLLNTKSANDNDGDETGSIDSTAMDDIPSFFFDVKDEIKNREPNVNGLIRAAFFTSFTAVAFANITDYHSLFLS